VKETSSGEPCGGTPDRFSEEDTVSKEKNMREKLLQQGLKDLNEGRVEEALDRARQLIRLNPEDAEGLFLMGAALVADGQYEKGLRYLEGVEDMVVDEALHRWWRGEAHFNLGRFENAGDDFQEALRLDPDFPDAVYALARTLEHLDRRLEAEQMYRWAAELDEEAFPFPVRLDREDFDEVVNEAREELPREIQKALERVPIIVVDLPSRELILSGKPPLPPDSLGLFAGRSLQEESVFDVPDVPAAVYLFRKNLERFARDEDELRDEIRKTLLHEVGHYLGLDEEELEERGLD
jgi:predicted Zn-dependent protease with MMP-like domain